MFGFLKKSADAPAATPENAAPANAAPPLSWRERLKAGLARTRAQLGGKLKTIFSRGKVDEELLEELESLLLTSDVGLEATGHLLDELKTRATRDCIETPEGIQKVEDAHPDVTNYTASIDQCLNEHGYIIPGLGDAGDKIFGTR